MRAVVQRVTSARVLVDDEVVGAVGAGLCVLLAVMKGDGPQEAEKLAQKIARLRIFPDLQDRMNESVSDCGGAILAVSQFTLAGDARKGNRPSFVEALQPQQAQLLFEHCCASLQALGLRVETGRFQTHMRVQLENDGPVTILLDTAKAF